MDKLWLLQAWSLCLPAKSMKKQSWRRKNTSGSEVRRMIEKPRVGVGAQKHQRMWCIPTLLQNTQEASELPWGMWCSEALNSSAQYLCQRGESRAERPHLIRMTHTSDTAVPQADTRQLHRGRHLSVSFLSGLFHSGRQQHLQKPGREGRRIWTFNSNKN